MIGERSKALGEKTPRIYFFSDHEACEDGLTNWLGDALEESGELVLLEVNLNGVAIHSDAGYEISSAQAIAPQRIVAIYDENWAPHPQFALPRRREHDPTPQP